MIMKWRCCGSFDILLDVLHLMTVDFNIYIYLIGEYLQLVRPLFSFLTHLQTLV